MCVVQRHTSCSGIQDRNTKAPFHTNEKYGHAESRVIHVAAPNTLAPKKPKLLGYNGTTELDIMIKNPGTLSIYRKRGRTII
jgi:hypothetical protein